MKMGKGFKILTLVLSILAGPLVFFLCCMAWGVGGKGHIYRGYAWVHEW